MLKFVLIAAALSVSVPAFAQTAPHEATAGRALVDYLVEVHQADSQCTFSQNLAKHSAETAGRYKAGLFYRIFLENSMNKHVRERTQETADFNRSIAESDCAFAKGIRENAWVYEMEKYVRSAKR